jgi:uncharacterized protein
MKNGEYVAGDVCKRRKGNSTRNWMRYADWRRKVKLLLRVLSIMLLLGAGSTWAGQYEDGVAAYNRRDYVNALRLLRPLAEQGHAGAQANVASMYFSANGVAQDFAEAFKWFRLSAPTGIPYAQSTLATMYAQGWGVPQDYAEAVKWYRLAAAQGDLAALYMLGSMYSFGRGVAQDYVRAHMWFNLSAAKGLPDAERDRDLTAQRMTPQQVARAQEMARRCEASKYKQCD